MKQLILMGTTGNNVCVLQIPTAWPLTQTKHLFEQALLRLSDAQRNSDREFVYIADENELEKNYPIESKFIQVCRKIIVEIGIPANENDINWYLTCQAYLFNNPDLARIVKTTEEKGLTKEEYEFAMANHLDILRTIMHY